MPIFLFCLPCLSLIFYFLILGLLFPSKRKFIKDAINCFWTKARGKYCSDSFDDLVHKQFVMWLSEKNLNSLAKWFAVRRNFDIALVASAIVFILLHTVLFILLIKWLFIKSPCGGEGVCSL